MKTEYEVRMLNIDVNEVIGKLQKLGATKSGQYYQRRFVYDFMPAQKGRWIRLRTNGMDTTLTIKEVTALRIDGTKELEIIVSDFNTTNEMLKKMGYTPRTYQENFRIEYVLNHVKFDIDKWPMIPSYLEIEGESEADVIAALELMGISHDQIIALDVAAVYKEQYHIDIDEIQLLCFNEQEKKLIESYGTEENI